MRTKQAWITCTLCPTRSSMIIQCAQAQTAGRGIFCLNSFVLGHKIQWVVEAVQCNPCSNLQAEKASTLDMEMPVSLCPIVSSSRSRTTNIDSAFNGGDLGRLSPARISCGTEASPIAQLLLSRPQPSTHFELSSLVCLHKMQHRLRLG